MNNNRNKTVKERLFENRRIDPITNCWLWTGKLQYYGHALIKINYKSMTVPRAAYEEFIGPLKDFCLHKRECPNAHCFNPNHLYDGTQSENRMDEMAVNKRDGFGAAINRRERTHCPKGHEFGPNPPYHHGGRVCVTCQKEHGIARRKRLKELKNSKIKKD